MKPLIAGMAAAGALLAVFPAAAPGDVWIDTFTRTSGGDVYEGDTVILMVQLRYSHGAFYDASGEVHADRATWGHWPRTEPVPAAMALGGGLTTHTPFIYRQDGLAQAAAWLTGGRTLSWDTIGGFPVPVLDYDYDGSTRYLYFDVLNAAPTITSLTPDLTVQPGETFSFSAAATDPGVFDVVTYAWDLDDDGLYDDFTGSSGTTSFSAPGLYPLAVQVSDGDGGYAHGSFHVDVVPEPGTCALWGAGSLALLYWFRRGRRRTK